MLTLTAYNDEYEVTRLYANGEFDKKTQETFEGNYKLKYHLAQILRGAFLGVFSFTQESTDRGLITL